MRTLPRPIVASLNGTVAGAGAAIALAADLRVAADTARIAFLFVKVGLAGADMGAAHLLPRMVGLGRATELLMTGDFIEADEALRIGLYNRVVPGGRAGRRPPPPSWTGWCAVPRPGLAATKAALESEMNMDLESALEAEARIQAELMRGRGLPGRLRRLPGEAAPAVRGCARMKLPPPQPPDAFLEERHLALAESRRASSATSACAPPPRTSRDPARPARARS